MLTQDEKYKLLSEMDEIVNKGVTLKNFRRIREIKSLLISNGVSDNIISVFDPNQNKIIYLIENEDGSYEELSKFIARRN